MFYKLIWACLTFLVAIFFKQIKFPAYIGKPIFTKGLNRVSIGKRTRIFPGARIETYNHGSIEIMDNVAIGQNFHITSSDLELLIGSNTTILGNVFVTNIDHDYQELSVHILEQKYIIKKTEIGENCFIGYGAAIQAGTILGKQCVVGANSVVRGIFPDYCVIVGTPAHIVKRYDFERKGWYKTNFQGDFLI